MDNYIPAILGLLMDLLYLTTIAYFLIIKQTSSSILHFSITHFRITHTHF